MRVVRRDSRGVFQYAGPRTPQRTDGTEDGTERRFHGRIEVDVDAAGQSAGGFRPGRRGRTAAVATMRTGRCPLSSPMGEWPPLLDKRIFSGQKERARLRTAGPS
ncbi:hypothetical protein Mro03_41460 [Microbispora rosea subsp. rosea]|nr:hypothetical protein Mro03_41460 [Microbispora rosea subsp. rosea]